jgi:hypothetical protein
MGYAVNDTADLPSGYLPGQVEHHDQWHWPQPYRRYAELMAQSPGLAAVADGHWELWTRLLAAVPDGAAVLVVCHGGGIEPALVTCLPQADHGSWGPPFSHCDGARLCFDQGSFVDIEFHRVQDIVGHADALITSTARLTQDAQIHTPGPATSGPASEPGRPQNEQASSPRNLAPWRRLRRGFKVT